MKTLRIKNSSKSGLYGYSRLTKRELVELLQRVEPVDLLQREEEPMDIDLPSDWVRYDGYADSEFLVHVSYVNDDEYWRYRLQLKFGCHQLNVGGIQFSFKWYLQTAIYKNISKLIFIIECPRRCFKFSL